MKKTWKAARPSEQAVRRGVSDCFVPRNSTGMSVTVENFKIATWNINSRGVDPESDWERADMILAMDAHILVLQEVSSLRNFDNFQSRCLGPFSYPYRILIQGNDLYHHIAMASRFPIKKAYTYRDRDLVREAYCGLKYFRRDLLEAEVEVAPGFRIKLLTFHFMSMRHQWSKVEARFVAGVASSHLRENSKSMIIVLGDYNEKTAYSMIKDAGLFAPFETKRDNILVSAELAKQYVDGSGAKFKPKISMQMNPSDHEPVIAAFKVPQAFQARNVIKGGTQNVQE